MFNPLKVLKVTYLHTAYDTRVRYAMDFRLYRGWTPTCLEGECSSSTTPLHVFCYAGTPYICACMYAATWWFGVTLAISSIPYFIAQVQVCYSGYYTSFPSKLILVVFLEGNSRGLVGTWPINKLVTESGVTSLHLSERRCQCSHKWIVNTLAICYICRAFTS